MGIARVKAAIKSIAAVRLYDEKINSNPDFNFYIGSETFI